MAPGAQREQGGGAPGEEHRERRGTEAGGGEGTGSWRRGMGGGGAHEGERARLGAQEGEGRRGSGGRGTAGGGAAGSRTLRRDVGSRSTKKEPAF